MHTVFIPHTKFGSRIGKDVYSSIAGAHEAIRKYYGISDGDSRCETTPDANIYWVRHNKTDLAYVEATAIKG